MPSGFLDRNDEPTLLFRCEDGVIAAYVTMNPPEPLESGAIPEGAVPIQLDSTPACEPG